MYVIVLLDLICEICLSVCSWTDFVVLWPGLNRYSLTQDTGPTLQFSEAHRYMPKGQYTVQYVIAAYIMWKFSSN